MIQKSCDPLQATERLQLVSWWYYQASCGFSCSDRFLLPNLKSTVQAHRQNRCEICLTLKEAPAQKYHQLSLSVSSDDRFHFCSSRSERACFCTLVEKTCLCYCIFFTLLCSLHALNETQTQSISFLSGLNLSSKINLSFFSPPKSFKTSEHFSLWLTSTLTAQQEALGPLEQDTSAQLVNRGHH